VSTMKICSKEESNLQVAGDTARQHLNQKADSEFGFWIPDICQRKVFRGQGGKGMLVVTKELAPQGQ
jgi:hypothetical protein